MKSKRVVFGIIGSVALVALAVTLSLRTSQDQGNAGERAEPPTQARSANSEATAQQGSGSDTTRFNSSGKPGAPDPQGLKADLAKFAQDEARSFETAPPFLPHFKNLEKKALKTPEEKREIEELLSSPKNIEMASKYLLDSEQPSSFHNQVRRLETVDFLVQSAEWSANPSRQATLEAMREIILSQNIREGVGLETRKSLAGDKIELFNAIQKADPNLAKAIQRDVAGTPTEKILQHASAYEKSLKRD